VKTAAVPETSNTAAVERQSMAYTVRFQNGHRVTNQTFPDAVKKDVEGSFLTLYDANGREIRTFSSDVFVAGAPGDSL
jgi:hypothetical protein